MRTLQEAASKLSPKRKWGTSGVDGWYPYYAGFSYEFAKSVLTATLDGRRTVVLDPWNGSGTTTAAAAHLGHATVGLDLNPVAVVIARSKLATRSEVARLRKNVDICMARAMDRPSTKNSKDDPLTKWLPNRGHAFARSALNALLENAGVGSFLDVTPEHALVAICLLGAFRNFAVDETSSNATWTVPKASAEKLLVSAIKRRVNESVARIVTNIATCGVSRPRPCRSQLGDARRTTMPSNSVGFILASPPYCTRIDYARQTMFEHAALIGKGELDIRELRCRLMGTTTIRERFVSCSHFPRDVSQLLARIAEHPSHRSRGYYARNFSQYFDDAMQALQETSRVLEERGNALFVLQNSYYKEIEIPLSDLYCAMGKCVGLRASVVARQPVKRNMTSVNTRSRAYLKERKYSEDLVLFEKL